MKERQSEGGLNARWAKRTLAFAPPTLATFLVLFATNGGNAPSATSTAQAEPVVPAIHSDRGSFPGIDGHDEAVTPLRDVPLGRDVQEVGPASQRKVSYLPLEMPDLASVPSLQEGASPINLQGSIKSVSTLSDHDYHQRQVTTQTETDLDSAEAGMLVTAGSVVLEPSRCPGDESPAHPSQFIDVTHALREDGPSATSSSPSQPNLLSHFQTTGSMPTVDANEALSQQPQACGEEPTKLAPPSIASENASQDVRLAGGAAAGKAEKAELIALTPSLGVPLLDPRVDVPQIAETAREVYLAQLSSELAESRLPVRSGERVMGAVQFQVTDGEISIHIGQLLDLFVEQMDAEEFASLRASAAAEQFVSLNTVRAAGIPLAYNAIYDELALEPVGG